MKKKILITALVVFGSFSTPTYAESPNGEQAIIEEIDLTEIGSHLYKPTHQQDVWVSVLEWCESRGNNNAINPMDRDGTPSWYAFQFKPATFKGYGIKYGLLRDDLEPEDYLNFLSMYDYQREIVNRMLNDPDVVWTQEFPQCVLTHG